MSEQEHIKAITRAVRKADEQFERSGGSSRHWVIECLLPELEKEGLEVVPSGEERASEPPSQFFTLRRVRQQIGHLLRKYRPRTTSIDGKMMIEVAEVVEDLDTLQVLAEMQD